MQISLRHEASPLRVLVHAPFGKDCEVITRVLERAGIGTSPCLTLPGLYTQMEIERAGAIILAAEASGRETIRELAVRLANQAPWSDLPILVMTSGGETDEATMFLLGRLKPLGNVTLLERPLRKITLISSVQSALRARERQYEIREFIEEQKRSETALRGSEARWRFLANAVPQFIWIARLDGSTEFLNRYWYEYTGCDPGTSTWADAIHADDLQNMRQQLGRAWEGGEETIFEYRVKRARDDAWRWHLGIIRPERDAAGSIWRSVGVGIDIHDRQVAEASLRRANSALEQFAYAAAHDLQEPVRNVLLYSQLLARNHGTQLDKEGKGFLDLTIDSAGRMRDLIHDLLAYTRVVDGPGARSEISRTEDVIEEVKKNLGAALESSQGEVTFDKLPDLPMARAHVIQLFQNLVSNSLKYRGSDPPRVHIRADRAHGGWLFTVQDNGQGISREHAESIFQIFRRLHGREVPGTGIGLAICQRVVSHYGGRIWVESEPGKGAAFRFILPVAKGVPDVPAHRNN